MQAIYIPVGEAVKTGWNKMKDNIGFFIGLLLITWIVSAVPRFIAGYLMPRTIFVGMIFSIINFAISIIISIGLLRISLKFCDNAQPGIGDLFSGFSFFLNYFFAYIIYILIVIGGMLLLVFPGVIWGIKFSFFPYFVVDKGLGPVDALKASAKATDGVKWDLLGFYSVIIAINISGVLCLMIGSFAALPTTMIATALIYRKLVSQHLDTEPSPAQEAQG